jgi:hypothetical protein
MPLAARISILLTSAVWCTGCGGCAQDAAPKAEEHADAAAPVVKVAEKPMSPAKDGDAGKAEESEATHEKVSASKHHELEASLEKERNLNAVLQAQVKELNAPTSIRVQELKWAREVAESFMESIQARAYRGQKALTTHSFQEENRPTENTWRLRQELSLVSWTITAQEIAPGGDECRFKINAKMQDVEPDRERTGTFTLHLVRETETGKWRVSFCNCLVLP